MSDGTEREGIKTALLSPALHTPNCGLVRWTRLGGGVSPHFACEVKMGVYSGKYILRLTNPLTSSPRPGSDRAILSSIACCAHATATYA
jgi:hypothetical protein